MAMTRVDVTFTEQRLRVQLNLQQVQGSVQVDRVEPQSAAHGRVAPGATLVAVNGERIRPLIGRPAWAAFPHAELAEDLDDSQLDTLTRYFGAGVTVRTIDDWSLTVEGGAYFQDSSEDQLVLFDPETGERMRLLEDLDRVDADAIGESQSRSVRPVGHLVLRRRF